MAWAAPSAGPATAYLYDWNILPLGQALWLKELETYRKFPPMQDPASYNLEQVMEQLKKPQSEVASDTEATVAREIGWHQSSRCQPSQANKKTS